MAMNETAPHTPMRWADKVVYQIYVRSFYDSDGDGLGDLRGITQKIAYIAGLGVDYIWLNPFYPSPQNDNGYDVADYCAVDPRFGTMRDFEELAAAAREHDIGLMLDMVFNHTSTEHVWFKKALAGDERYRAYYFFREGKPDGSPPANWRSKFGGSAWEKTAGGEFYLHLFDKTQADLNWENAGLRGELYKILEFWLEKGAAAFRFDVINLIGKSGVFADDQGGGDGRRFYTDGENAHTYIREMNAAVFAGREVLTVGELSSTTKDHCTRYASCGGEELSMAFHFHHLKTDYADGEKWRMAAFDFDALRNLMHEWQVYMCAHNAHDALFWNNHDQPRALTRFASGKPEYHFHSAALLAAAIHFMRGTPYVYMGEEIGMTNPGFASIDAYRDVESINYYRILRGEGMAEEAALALVRHRSRDNSRTPMQWSAEAGAGFTAGVPWIQPAPDYAVVNVAAELAKPDGVRAFYAALIRLRKTYAVIQQGDYTPLFEDVPGVLAYRRHCASASAGERTLYSLHNFFERHTSLAAAALPAGFADGRVLAANYPPRALGGTLELRPYETLTVLV